MRWIHEPAPGTVSTARLVLRHMRDIVCTSRDGERFWKIPECYVRGNSIKYLRLPDEAVLKKPFSLSVGLIFCYN